MKFLTIALGLLVFGAVIVLAARAAGKTEIKVRKVEPADSGVLEQWERVTDEEEIFGVSASRTAQPKWKWQVFVAAAEFVREEPLESTLVERITSALKKVEGVKAVAHEDREVWIIEGDPSGEALVRAASTALDSLAPQLRKHMESL
jgi:hypothetical protein